MINVLWFLQHNSGVLDIRIDEFERGKYVRGVFIRVCHIDLILIAVFLLQHDFVAIAVELEAVVFDPRVVQ